MSGGAAGLWNILGIVSGIILFVIGLWVMRLARRHLHADGAHASSGPTRLTLGCVLVLTGYHLVIWSVPAWNMAAVPVERWWLVPGVGAVAVGGALLAEWLEGRA